MQTRYSHFPVAGAAGGIVDLAPYAIDSLANENDTGVMKFGMGVVAGTVAGTTVKVPVAASTAAAFEGIVVNNRSTEHDLEGNLAIRNKGTVGVMRQGRVYGRVMTGVSPAYGDPVFLVTSGSEAGYFTNAAAALDAEYTTIPVNARFIGAVDAIARVAPIELFGGPIDKDTVYTLPTASADALGGVKVGAGLAINENGVLSVSGQQ